uniref:telomeric repeat binding factor a n=1 Tax=Scatophagus argus TaxID=75038 RepID=UPI001ED80AFE|nr:telomeric repeat binding factor a [Scatophagus argus]
MAAKEIVNSRQSDVEPIVNRWLTDFYFSLALELFQKEQYADFLGIRHVLDSVLVRPLEVTDATQIKIRVLQFLSRINEGESLDVSFESDQISPLESAMILLEHINQEFSIPQQDFENVCTALKEMIVMIFIRNNEFDKAEEVLKKHFPKPMVGKKAIFMGLIRRKSKKHEVIDQINFQQFKVEMLAFCEKLCPVSVPFLHKAAKMCIDKRLREPDDNAAGPDEQDEPGPSSVPQINTNVKFAQCKRTTISKSRLAVAYRDLCPGSDEKTFVLLDEEMKRDELASKELSLHLSPTPTKGTNKDSEQDGLFQRDSGSPMEASPADQPRQMDADPQAQGGSRSKTPSVTRKRRLYTVARLVVEPDSQGSSQCTAVSQELETEVRTEEPPQSPAIHTKKDLQNPVMDNEIAMPTRKYPRRARKLCSKVSTNMADLSADSDEERPDSVANRKTCVSVSRNSKSRQSSSGSGVEPQESVVPCKTPVQKPDKQLTNDPHSKRGRISPSERIVDRTRAAKALRKCTKTKQVSSDSEEEKQKSEAPCKTPVQKPCKQLGSDPHSRDPCNTEEVCVTDSSLDSSANPLPLHPIPQTSSTPDKGSAGDKGPSNSKWKQLFNNATESKDTWSDEESYFTSRKNSGGLHNDSTISNSGIRKKKWTETESQKLKEGVKKFGEGNWSKIKSYYSFNDRTNVNLKDRWRTMKKLNMV